MKPPVPDARAAPGPAPAGGVFNVDRTNSLNQTLRKVTGLLGVGRILGRKDSNGEASTSDRGAEDCSPTDSGGPSLTESKSFASDASDGNGEPCVASPSYPFDTSSRGIGSENSRLPGGRATDAARVARFKKILAAQSVDVDALRELAWSGVPPFLRPTVWRLLLGYASPNADRRDAALARKRQEYMDCVPQYYDIPDADRTEDEIVMLHQIGVDAPRTLPEVPFFQEPVIQTTLKRILYIWYATFQCSY
ncbi:hypothetical protein KC19_10G190000 [Ceratodon purpureus]|uniref:Rab-GAP TBC domain-containing protein n=1 Tax=Ceratodon purpureus TaxID=3225 RepID=A0A8T0GUE4_CERPU|nr:hypothetical protein KC19_10G190000 [Ceratodon purpureus]